MSVQLLLKYLQGHRQSFSLWDSYFWLKSLTVKRRTISQRFSLTEFYRVETVSLSFGLYVAMSLHVAHENIMSDLIRCLVKNLKALCDSRAASPQTPPLKEVSATGAILGTWWISSSTTNLFLEDRPRLVNSNSLREDSQVVY